MEIVGGEKREKDFLASLSSSFPALLDTLFHRREIHRGTRSSSRPISRYPVGKNRSSCLSTSQGGARYARCRPVIKNKAAAIINSATRMLETLVSIVETFERNGHCRGKLLLLPSKRKEEPAWVDFFIAVRIKFLNQKMRK